MKRICVLGLVLLVCIAHGWKMPFVGPGMGTQGKELPVMELRVLGSKWVKGNWPIRELQEWRIKSFLRHFSGFPALIILDQNSPTPAADALNLIRWGVRNIEVGNEPEQGIYNPGGKVWSGEEYGRFFKRIAKVVSGRARLYGPAVGSYDPDYIAAAIKGGMKADCLSWHGYWSKIANLPHNYNDARRRFRLPSLCSEVGFPVTLGSTDYRSIGGDPVRAYVQCKATLKNLAWCWYDGPVPAGVDDDKSVGLFEWTGFDYSVTTPTYKAIVAALRG